MDESDERAEPQKSKMPPSDRRGAFCMSRSVSRVLS